MWQRLLFAACVLLVAASSDANQMHKKSSFVQPPHNLVVCNGDRVKCPTTDLCIWPKWLCDGVDDCGDASDEENCQQKTCSEFETKCPTTHVCKDSDVFCDGKNDCGDNSDEPENCSTRICPEGQLKCNSGQCIDSLRYCYNSAGCRDFTLFLDFICPEITCNPGYFKCPNKSVCIKSSSFCDGVDDCRDSTDEPADCRERSCVPGAFRCDNGQCLNRNALCLSITQNGCTDSTDITNLCSDFTCPTGYFKCVSDGKCIANSKLCDGSADCSDSSDELMHNCAIDCPIGQAKCPSAQRCIQRSSFCNTLNDCLDNSDENELFCRTRTCQPWELRCQNGQCIDIEDYCNGVNYCRDGSFRVSINICYSHAACLVGQAHCPSRRFCISTRNFCDTNNDCGDNSDENELFCGHRNCQLTEVRCNNGQCLDKDSFCNGEYFCRDGSFSDKSDVCSNQGSAHLESNSNQGYPQLIDEEIICAMAITQLPQTCTSTLTDEMFALPRKDALKQLVEMDLSNVCVAAQRLFACYQRKLTSPCTGGVIDPAVFDLEQIWSVAERVLNYVCVQHVEVFNRNKACLLREDGSDPDINSPKLILVETLGASCGALWKPPRRREQDIFCSVTDEFHGCAKDVVARQCGNEVAGALSGLANLVAETADCNNASQSRSLRTVHKRNRGFPIYKRT